MSTAPPVSHGADFGATARALALLDGTAGIDVPAATRMLQDASRAGDGQACAFLGVLAGAGIGRPPDWREALEFTERAARLGWEPARQQLGLLVGRPGTEGEAGPPNAHAAVDVAAWLTPPPKRPLCDSPRVRVFENFLPAAACVWLIERARGRLARARVYDAATGQGIAHHARTNSETDFPIAEIDLVLLLIRARIAAAAALPPAVLELTKLLRYAPGQEFGPHHDYIDPTLPSYAAEVAARGQRLATLLVYLNDDYEGGETEFPHLGIRFRGRRGDALLFANVDAAGRPDPRSLHAGLSPQGGEKWVLSQWMRDRSAAPA